MFLPRASQVAVTLSRCYFFSVSTITAKELHQKTSAVLNQLERGESLMITRNGRILGRIEPITKATESGWAGIMQEVWRVQEHIKKTARVPNPVLQERQRRRR